MNEEKTLVQIVKASMAPKLSPRSSGQIGYELGLCDSAVLIRITENQGGGKFSKEWLPVEAIVAAMPEGAANGEPFHATALAGAFQKRSHNNHCFLAAVLRAEGILEPAGEKAGQSVLARRLEDWAGETRALDTIRTEPLVPEKLKKKGSDAEASAEPVPDGKGAEPDKTEPEPANEAGDVEGISEPPKKAVSKKGRRRKGAQPEPEPQESPERESVQDAPAMYNPDEADEDAG